MFDGPCRDNGTQQALCPHSLQISLAIALFQEQAFNLNSFRQPKLILTTKRRILCWQILLSSVIFPPHPSRDLPYSTATLLFRLYLLEVQALWRFLKVSHKHREEQAEFHRVSHACFQKGSFVLNCFIFIKLLHKILFKIIFLWLRSVKVRETDFEDV